jgi:hypothetical protein
LTAWAQAISNNAKLALFTNDASTAVLAVDAKNKIIILHSFKNFWGTILEPTNKLAGFISNGRVASATIVIKVTLLLAHADFVMPPYASIVACLNNAEIEALAHPALNATPTYHGITLFLPAPWLLEAVSNINSNDPALIILLAAKAAAEFDNEYEDNKEYFRKAKD